MLYINSPASPGIILASDEVALLVVRASGVIMPRVAVAALVGVAERRAEKVFTY